MLRSTCIPVSQISLGTVELGLDYGFKNSAVYRRPAEDDAIQLLRRAPELGVNLFDTAGAYGESERLIGRALSSMTVRPYVATKVAITPMADPSDITQSVDRSRTSLGLATLYLLQIHNATRDVLRDQAAMRCLDSLVEAGKVRYLGASVYTEADALAVLDQPRFRTLQIAFNLLDTKMAEHVIPTAARNGVAVLVRSAFLRGVLTPRIHETPPQLHRLKQAALAALQLTGGTTDDLAAIALRYCLSVPGVSSVIVGVRTIEELEANLSAAAQGPLEPALFAQLQRVEMPGDPLVSPLNWQGLI